MINAILVLLGLGFIVAGGLKITSPERAFAAFAAWGAPGGGFVVLAGWIEIFLGLSLLNQPTRRLGALALGTWMLPWIVLQAFSASPAALASSLVLIVAFAHALPSQGLFRLQRPWLISPLTDKPKSVGDGAHRLIRIVGVAFLIRWAVGGELYWAALPALALWSQPAAGPRSPVEPVLLHLLVLGLGVSGIWGFVGHTFLADSISQSVGWPVSPFQSELAFYHFGVGLAGLACWWVRDNFWLAAATIPSVFLYGAGWVHTSDFFERGNASAANWGFSVFFGNLVLPTLLLVLSVARLKLRKGL